VLCVILSALLYSTEMMMKGKMWFSRSWKSLGIGYHHAILLSTNSTWRVRLWSPGILYRRVWCALPFLLLLPIRGKMNVYILSRLSYPRLVWDWKMKM
jgi:hypothetical protein